MTDVVIVKPHELLMIAHQYLPAHATIVEAGAFDGKDTATMSKMWPSGQVHAFEPVAEIFKRLQANTSSLANVTLYQLALSDSSGLANIFISQKPEKPNIASQANSLLRPLERLKHSSIIFPQTEQVQTITLDDWAKQHAISHVDLLRLDLQGYELNVLMAGPHLLKTVQVIITEVEFIQAYENQYQYQDVKQWLENQGFVMVAKDFDDSPTWFFGNALFVKKELL